MTCTIIAAVVNCTLLGPTPSPADAAKILTTAIPPYVAIASDPFAYDPGGYYVPPLRQTTDPSPERRLDGTLWTVPSIVYGDPYGVGWRASGYRGNRYRGGGRSDASPPILRPPSGVTPVVPRQSPPPQPTLPRVSPSRRLR